MDANRSTILMIIAIHQLQDRIYGTKFSKLSDSVIFLKQTSSHNVFVGMCWECRTSYQQVKNESVYVHKRSA